MLVGATEVELVQVCRLEHQRGEEDEFKAVFSAEEMLKTLLTGSVINITQCSNV